MVWDARTSNGNESAKIRWACVPYVRGVGLDLGCGPWKVFPHAIGLDGACYPEAGHRGPSLMMECTSLPIFASESMDFVYSSHFLEHVRDPLLALREWFRLVRVGGHLILYLPHKDFYPNIGEPGANPDHKNDFVPADVIRLMKQLGGWSLVENEERSGGDEYSFFQVYRKRADAFHLDVLPANKPKKTAALARPGNFGDALWISSIAHQLKREGYHVTAYVENRGELVLQNNPDIDRIVMFDRAMFFYGEEMQAFFEHEATLYEKFVNFSHSVEVNLLSMPGTLAYDWPDDVRRERCKGNYVQFMHKIAQVPYELKQRFCPTADEVSWAKRTRREMAGRVVVLANTGSTAPKWWPYAPAFAALLAELGVHTVVVGDLHGLVYPNDPLIHVMGMTKWSIRESITFAMHANAVVGQETGLLNALAIEAVPKVVMLSHSTVENLTRDWKRTASLAGAAACYPCHRIHFTHAKCPQDAITKAAACQAAISVERVIEALIELQVLTASDRAVLETPAAALEAQPA